MAIAINQLPVPAQKKPARAKSAATAAAAVQRALNAKAGMQTSATLEFWTEKRLAPALALVPEHLRVKTAFAPSTTVVSNAL